MQQARNSTTRSPLQLLQARRRARRQRPLRFHGALHRQRGGKSGPLHRPDMEESGMRQSLHRAKRKSLSLPSTFLRPRNQTSNIEPPPKNQWGGSQTGEAEMTSCTDGTYCCGHNNLTCCGTQWAVKVPSLPAPQPPSPQPLPPKWRPPSRYTLV